MASPGYPRRLLRSVHGLVHHLRRALCLVIGPLRRVRDAAGLGPAPCTCLPGHPSLRCVCRVPDFPPVVVRLRK